MSFIDIAKRIKGGLEVFTDPTARREAIEGIALSVPTIPSPSQLLSRIEPTEKVRFRDVAREILPITEKGVDLFQDLIVRFPARAAGSITLGILEELTPGTSRTLTPEGTLEKFFFGEEELKSVQRRGTETTKAITDFGIPKSTAEGLSLVAIGALTGLDLLPFGGSKKVLGQQLLKTRSVRDALSILGKLGVPDDVARVYAPKFVQATNIKVVEKGLKSLEDVIKTTKITPTAIPKELEPLAQEAKKFKTAEKFATSLSNRNVGELVQDIPIKTIRKSDFFQSELVKAQKEIAEGTARSISKEPIRLFFKPKTNDFEMVDGFHRLAIAISKGNSSIKSSIETVASKSQLTDFFNQAKGVDIKPPSPKKILGIKPSPFVKQPKIRPDVGLRKELKAEEVIARRGARAGAREEKAAQKAISAREIASLKMTSLTSRFVNTRLASDMASSKCIN